tara:strand:+ start:453 stop:683 length:231 start_codon:yes stop_codon:yes gene_type:complete
MEAWFKASEITASSEVKIASKRPAFASKQEGYKIVSSNLWKLEITDSSSLCLSWVPQMNLTDAIPNPWVSIEFFAA